MSEWIYLILAVCAGITIAAVLVVYLKVKECRNLVDRINNMIEEAKNGQFREERFNEDIVSKVETNMAQYLAASEKTKQQVCKQKQAIEELIADISHQTKTPIANLLLFSDLLLEKDMQENSHHFVELMNEQTKKLEFLIRELIKTSRLENGIVVVKPERQSVVTMLQSVCRQAEPKARAKAIELVLEEQQEKEMEAVFDERWTTEALFNIVDNAVKYTQGGGKVTVRTVKYEMFLAIEVEDNGMGIEEAEQAQVFQRFYRSRKVSAKEGVGLGLYLAREIVTKEGGYIKLYSKPGEMTKFALFLLR